MNAEERPLPNSDSADPLEARLRAEAWLAEPGDLAARIMLGLPSRRAGVDRRALVRFAAAVVAAFGVWLLTTGAVPSLAAAAPQPIVERALVDTRAVLPEALGTSLTPWAANAAAPADTHPALLAACGLALWIGGLWLARRLLRRPPGRSAP